MNSYAVIPHTVYFKGGSRERRTMWQVVDVNAGMTDRSFARVVLATCKEQHDANRICAMYNGVGVPQFDSIVWQGCLDFANKNAREAREALQTWQDKCTSLIAERDEARKDHEQVARILSNTIKERDTWRAELNAINDALRSDLTAARRRIAAAEDRANRLQTDFDIADKKLGEIYDILEGGKS